MQPLFYAALCYVAGSFAAFLLPQSPWPLRAGLIAAGLMATVFFIPGLRRRFAGRRALAIGLLPLCFAAGAMRTGWGLRHPPRPDSLRRVLGELHPGPRENVRIRGYLRDTPVVTHSYLRFDLSCRTLEARGRIWYVRGGLRLFGYWDHSARNKNPGTRADPRGLWAHWLPRLTAGQGLVVTVHPSPPPHYLDPGVPDFGAGLRRQGIDFEASVPPDALHRLHRPPRRGSFRLRAAVWAGISRGIDRLLPPSSTIAGLENAGAAQAGASHVRLNALLRAMLLGDPARLGDRTRRVFQADGIYHLLVIAGLHIGILAGLIFALLRLFRIPSITASFLTLACLAVYVWVIATRVPSQRALLMLAIYFLARAWYRERQPLNAVGAAALLLLLWRPLAAAQTGWQMSLTAALLLAGMAAPVASQVFGRRVHALRELKLKDNNYAEGLTPRWAHYRIRWHVRCEGWAGLPPVWPRAVLVWRLVPPGMRFLLRAAELLWISLVLQIGFAGFMLAVFHRANPWAVLANALIVPLAGLWLPLAWLALASGAVFPGLNVFWQKLLVPLGHVLLWTADHLARLPGANLRVPTPPLWTLIIYAAGLALWLWLSQHWLRRQRKLDAPLALLDPSPPVERITWSTDTRPAAPSKPSPPRQSSPGLNRALVICLLFLIGVTQWLAFFPFAPRLRRGVLTAWFLDVGQGDAIFTALPDGRTFLVDAGPKTRGGFNAGRALVSPFLWSRGLRHLDAVLLTRPHLHSLAPLRVILRRFHPEEVWVPAGLPASARDARFLALARRLRAHLRVISAGQRYRAGSIYIQALNPPAGLHFAPRRRNADSVVLRLAWGNNALLFTGDIGAEEERSLLAQGAPLASPVLKIADHGEPSATTPEFLAAVRPAVAVISVGAHNDYGLPAPRVLARLRRAGAHVWQTGRDGAVECRLYANRVSVWKLARLSH